ncbi:unnamed protein product [Cyclocybe aegerita]|uniref:Uncharacterized protein n=1 Tax=Cyclocybe aegerita TaxID=1973307 RepID=A0A8S0WGJ4_CYCAE|nr:unnamed protein product [Cyclocybe aegerita]
MKFQSAFIFLLSFASVSLAATVAVVVSDINNLKAGVTVLTSRVKAFPNTGGKLQDALGVPTPISEADGVTLLVAIRALASAIVDCSKALIAKHAAFAALALGNIPSVVRVDLVNLSRATTGFEDQFTLVIPTDQKPDAAQVRTEADDAFKAALAVYV